MAAESVDSEDSIKQATLRLSILLFVSNTHPAKPSALLTLCVTTPLYHSEWTDTNVNNLSIQYRETFPIASITMVISLSEIQMPNSIHRNLYPQYLQRDHR